MLVFGALLVPSGILRDTLSMLGSKLNSQCWNIYNLAKDLYGDKNMSLHTASRTGVLIV
jgi:hypothetical protein